MTGPAIEAFTESELDLVTYFLSRIQEEMRNSRDQSDRPLAVGAGPAEECNG